MKIAYGNSRSAKLWVNKETSFADLCARLTTPVRTTETSAEYSRMSKAQRNAVKDHGGFVGGHLRDNRRLAKNVICRSMWTADVDQATTDFFIHLSDCLHFKCAVYSTHSHTASNPRLRIIAPFAREVTPDEYGAVSRYLASEIGIDMFDPCSFSTNQLMYWPSCCADAPYFYQVFDGPEINPDAILALHPDWKDCSLLPTGKSENIVLSTNKQAQADPLEKSGIVGAFCRAYSIEDAIQTFLSDVYAPSVMDGRYDYIPADSVAGVVLYSSRFAYSHHASDPAYGMLLNAFDLVRIHKFPSDDEKKSFRAMSAFASQDPQVSALLLQEKQAEAKADFSSDDWTKYLSRSKGGLLENTLRNLQLILSNDEHLKAIRFNELADNMEITGEVPWSHPSKFWRDADDAQLICYIDANYGTFSARNYDIAVTKIADDRGYHPVRNFLDQLPMWDGTQRAATLLVDYLGAADNDYTQAITRKTLCGAVMRVKHPGIKFDSIPVLNGPQGIGKSTLIARLGGDWYSDSVSLTDMNDKTAAEKLQGYWILEIGELAGMKKADIDKVKAFISRQDDKYRASFGRRVTPHPRQCIFFGTTNSEKGYLRDITGNRRFWTIKTPGNGTKKPWDMTQDDVNQIWAEVLVMCEQGETLYLDPQLEQYSQSEQADAIEQDDREGMVIAYLDRLLPENWSDMNEFARQGYLSVPDQETGTVQRQTVSNIEIWCECFCKKKEDIRPADSYAIAAIMLRIHGWEKTSERKWLSIYGQQRIYRRKP